MPESRRSRANSLGSVYRRGEKWRWELTLGYETIYKNGLPKPKRRSIGGTELTETAAQKALAAAITDHTRGLIAPNDDITLREYSQRWIDRQPLLEPSSRKNYLWELEFALKHFGSRRIKDVKSPELKDFVATLPRKTMFQAGKPDPSKPPRYMSPRTQTKIVTRLNSLFNEAVTDQIIYLNPMNAVKRRRGQAVEAVGQVYDFAQKDRCQEIGWALHDMDMLRQWIAVLLCLSLGLRRGEALGLTWSDVDFQARTLKIRRGLTGMHDSKPTFGPPKTKSSRRELGIPQSLLTALEQTFERQKTEKQLARAAWLPTGAIVATELGNHCHPDNLKRTLSTVQQWSDPAHLEYTDAAGRIIKPMLGVAHAHRATLEQIVLAGAALPIIRVHDLRHTYATLALRSKIPPEVVSKTLGHARISITMDTYRHVLESEMRENAFDLLASSQRKPLIYAPIN